MKRTIITMVTFSMILVLFTGCTDNKIEYIDEEMTEFQTNEDVEYTESLVDLSKDHAFTFTIDKKAVKKIKDTGYQTNHIFCVYVDAKLTQELDASYVLDNDTVTIRPNDTFVSIENEDHTLSISNAGDWGIFNYYYLVQNFDLDTGKKLKKPLVTVFTIKQELTTPNLKVTHHDDGSFVLDWNEVSGASEYLLIRIDFRYDHKIDGEIIATTKNTKWNSKEDGKDIDDVENVLFRTYNTSEDAQYTNNFEYWWEDGTTLLSGSMFAIVAKNEETTSSMALDTNKNNDPSKWTCRSAEYALSEVGFSTEINSINQLPFQVPVTSCTGNTVNQEVIIDENNTTIEDTTLHVPYTINNSTLHGEFLITSYNEITFKEDLKVVKETNHNQYMQTNTYEYRYKNTKMVAFNIKQSNHLPKIQDEVFSTSKLETFIAKNMIDGAAIIDISAFEEVEDIYDLMEQIRNQNPMILEMTNYQYNEQERKIYIQYLFDNPTRYQMQQKIREEVTKTIESIITKKMTDIEKVYAINQYICDQTTYNQAAADATNATGGYKMDEKYYAANTAAGVFIDGSAVCEGYAAAFTLLTKAAGLRSIMVTGYISNDSTIRHAWNRVLINEQWYVVDVTTNDVEGANNSILALADTTANTLLKQDEYFVLDDAIDTYIAGGDDSLEYYRYHGNFVSKDTAASTFASLLSKSNTATLKLPEGTTNEEYEHIANQVINRMNRSFKYVYLHGVMTITMK